MKLALAAALLATPALANEAEFLARASAAASQAAASARKVAACAPLSSGVSGDPEVTYQISSSACPMSPVPQAVEAALKAEFAKRGAQLPPNQTVYAYEYVIANLGTADIEIGFSADDFLMSPFFELAGSYGVRVPPGKALVVAYAAPVPPARGSSGVTVMKRAASGKPVGWGGGAAGLHWPDRYTTLYAPLKTAFVPAR